MIKLLTLCILLGMYQAPMETPRPEVELMELKDYTWFRELPEVAYAEEEVTEEVVDEVNAYFSDLEIVMGVVDAEARNQGYWGKRYVAAVIINRLNSGYWGSTFQEVVNAPGQFEVVSLGMVGDYSEETYQAVIDEYYSRSDTSIIYFRAGFYHSWANDAFQHGDHYFSY